MECRSRDVSVCERVVLFHPLSSDCLITRSNWCCYSSYPTCKSEIYGADLRWCIYLPGSIILIVLETATIGLVILQRHSGALRPVQPVHQNSVFIQNPNTSRAGLHKYHRLPIQDERASQAFLWEYQNKRYCKIQAFPWFAPPL